MVQSSPSPPAVTAFATPFSTLAGASTPILPLRSTTPFSSSSSPSRSPSSSPSSSSSVTSSSSPTSSSSSSSPSTSPLSTTGIGSSLTGAVFCFFLGGAGAAGAGAGSAGKLALVRKGDEKLEHETLKVAD